MASNPEDGVTARPSRDANAVPNQENSQDVADAIPVPYADNIEKQTTKEVAAHQETHDFERKLSQFKDESQKGDALAVQAESANGRSRKRDSGPPAKMTFE